MLAYLNNLNKHINALYIVIIFFFSISINQYFGYQGICPIDSFWFFNSGYDVLNGYYPFKDYWTIAGPFISYVQALFFKVFGVSWFSYVLHASIFNFIIAGSTYYTLSKFKLNINFCFLYALIVAILAYPSAGTPYVDHHATIISIVAVFSFILALKTHLKIYWFILPILLLFSFLSKQTPTGYIFLLIIFLSFIYFTFNFDIKKIFCGFLGSLIAIAIFILIGLYSEITFASFIDQYILFPISIGKNRFEYFLFPLEFSRIVLRFKLIHLSTIILIIVSFKNLVKNYKYLKNSEFLITLALIGTSYALIVHQLMTMNGMYIFFIIPILIGFSHIYYLKYYKNSKFILSLLIILLLGSTVNYSYKYIFIRDFIGFKKSKMENAINANIFSHKLNNLKWISCLDPNNPKREVEKLLEVIEIVKNDNEVKSIITDYQFISVILSTYDFSPSQVWFINHVASQEDTSKFYKKYNNFFTDKIKKHNIKKVYVIKPLCAGNEIFEKSLNKDCYTKMKITEISDVYILNKCDELN